MDNKIIHYLQADLLPGLNELLEYEQSLLGKIDSYSEHGLRTRIEALRDDLSDVLNGTAEWLIETGDAK
jgi:hypothetical protein